MRMNTFLVSFLAGSWACCATCSAVTVSAGFSLLAQGESAGVKPSATSPAVGDWLVGTGDDVVQPSSYNPLGAWSHNFADFAGSGGAGFNMAPSLTGSLTLQLTSGPGDRWEVSVTELAYSGQATPVMFMNQFLVTPGSPATQNTDFQVDGLSNAGTWDRHASANWAIQYDLDFILATNADGDPSPGDIDATFDNRLQRGYLLPVSELNPAGLSTLTLNDPTGFFPGDFHAYLLNEVAPRLPADATYVLFTQMDKAHPAYAEPGLPITTSGLVGNTTIAYTTTVIPEPGSLVWLLAAAGILFAQRNRKR